MKRVFIVNPVSGKGRAKLLIPLIKELFPDCIIEETKYSGHASQLSYDYSGPDTKIYSVGGDGTANEIANGLLGGVPLSIIPAGSGNDIIKSLTNETNPEEILRWESANVKNGYENNQKMDLGLMRFRDTNSDVLDEMYFLNVASIGGIDAKVGEIANNHKNRRNVDPVDIYKKSVPKALITFKAPRIQVALNNEEPIREIITLFTVCNGGFYGGKYNVAPQASISDGFFDVCHVDEISKLRIVLLMPDLEKGEHGKHTSIVHFAKARELKIESEVPLVGNVDGQFVKGNIYEFDNIHQGLIISTPKPKTLVYKRTV